MPQCSVARTNRIRALSSRERTEDGVSTLLLLVRHLESVLHASAPAARRRPESHRCGGLFTNNLFTVGPFADMMEGEPAFRYTEVGACAPPMADVKRWLNKDVVEGDDGTAHEISATTFLRLVDSGLKVVCDNVIAIVPTNFESHNAPSLAVVVGGCRQVHCAAR